MTAPNPVFNFPDIRFGPFSLAKFTLTGTGTSHPVYTTAALNVEHPDPLPSDDQGLFPDIFLDPTVQYRMRIIPADGDFANPVIDHDPVNELAFDLTSDDVVAALGYTPIGPDTGRFTSEVRLNYTDPLTILHADSAGFRIRPPVITDALYTLSLDDAGKLLLHDDTSSPTITIPPHSDVPLPIGTTVYLMNVNTGVPVVTRGASVQLRIAGSATNKDVSIAEWGEATLVNYGTDTWLIFGTGLS